MLYREICRELLNGLKVKQIIAITGMRRVGKTMAARYLLDQVKSTNKIYFDMERAENRMIFRQENYGNIVKSIEWEGIDLQKKACIALDEVGLGELVKIGLSLRTKYSLCFG